LKKITNIAIIKINLKQEVKQMKKASRILIIIGMALITFSAILTLSIFGATGYAVIQQGLSDGSITSSVSDDPKQIFTIVLVTLIVIFAIKLLGTFLVGFFALNRLKNATEKSQIIAPGVLLIIFGDTLSLVAGILMLCLPADSFQAQMKNN